MLTCNSSQLWAVAPKPKQSAPFLDIEELLDTKLWQERELTNEEKRSVNDTINFLRLVMVGRNIAEEAVEKKVISADSVSINAFRIARKGYQQANLRGRVSLVQTIEISLITLSKILKGIKKISAKDLEITYCFIKGVSTVVIY